ALLPAGRFARRTRVRGAREHAVFSRDPSLSLAAQERRNAVLDAGRAQHLRITELDEHRALGVTRKPAAKPHVTHLVRSTTAGASKHAHSPSQRSAAPEVLSLAGPPRATAISASFSNASRTGSGPQSSAAISTSVKLLHSPSVQTNSTSPGSRGWRLLMVMSGSIGSPPMQDSTKFRIG